jgi:S1/P1 Nuclease
MMRNSIRAVLLAAATLAITTAPAPAWDYPGHRMVGAIADFVLSSHHPKAYARVKELLATKDADGNKLQRTLSQVAVFPDCAKVNNVPFCGRTPSEEEKAYAGHNKHNTDYHFTDVPVQQSKYVADSPGTGVYDVVHMINYAVAQLRGKSPSKPEVALSDTEALWLLAHLVGDVHQPLHVGSLYYDKETCKQVKDPTGLAGGTGSVVSTIGGNAFQLVALAPDPAAPPNDNLHFFWDGTAVNGAMQAAGLPGAEQDFARLLAANAPADWRTDGDPEGWAAQWVTETLPLARASLAKLTFTLKERTETAQGKVSCTWTTQISPRYSKWASEQARKQITKAGFRLAALLTAIFEP